VPLRRPSEIRSATSIARSKIAARPASCARARAPARTFSSSRGTTTRKVGRTIGSSSASRSRSVATATSTPWSIATCTCIRPSACASGRNAIVRAGWREQLGTCSTVWRTLAARLAWVSSQPFGSPVVPEEYSIAARSSPRSASTRASTSSRWPVPAASSRSSAPSSIASTCVETAIRVRRPGHHLALLGGLDEGHAGAAVGQDRRDLRRRGGVVDGHRHRPGREDRVIEQHPLASGADSSRTRSPGATPRPTSPAATRARSPAPRRR
jgi:hypothetical protein